MSSIILACTWPRYLGYDSATRPAASKHPSLWTLFLEHTRDQDPLRAHSPTLGTVDLFGAGTVKGSQGLWAKGVGLETT